MQLVIQSHGVKVNLENGLFLIRHQDSLEKIPATQVGSILIAKGCSLSSNVIYYAAAHDIDIVFGSKDGKPVARIWSTKFGSIATIRKQQVHFAQSNMAMQWVAKLMINKWKHQQAVLNLLVHPHKQFDQWVEDGIQYIEKYIEKLNELIKHHQTIEDATLRGWEGVCSKRYFSIVSKCIPAMYAFDKRSQHPALDLFNAMLNYAYGMLYSRIETALVKAGIDPSIGIFHRDEYNKPVLVYDVIEQYRYWADVVVIQLCMQELLFPDHVKEEAGGLWLTQDGKQLLISTLNDYMAEIIEMDAQVRSRQAHIDLYCANLAQQFKQFENQ